MQIELNVNDKQADFFLNLLKSFKENSVIDNFEIVKEIDLTDKLKSSLEDVKLMRKNKKEKVDIEDFLNEL